MVTSTLIPACAFLAFALAPFAFAQVNSAPTPPQASPSTALAPPRSVRSQQGPFRGSAKSRVAPRTAADRSITPKRILILPAPPTGFIDELKRQDAAEGRQQRVRLGFTR